MPRFGQRHPLPDAPAVIARQAGADPQRLSRSMLRLLAGTALIVAGMLGACGGTERKASLRIESAESVARAAQQAGSAGGGTAATPDPRPVVFLDAGHGGRDPGWGASFILPNLPQEKEITLDMARRVAVYLEADGFRPVLSRTSDTDVNEPERDINGDGVMDIVDELQARADMANASGAVALLSMHLNGLPNTPLGGAGAYYNAQREFADKSKAFAEFVQAAQLEALASVGYQARDWGALREDAFATPTQAKIDTGYKFNTMIGPPGPNRTRPTLMPAVIAEPLFLTNVKEAELIQREDVRDALARGYAKAVRQFLQPERAATPSASSAPAARPAATGPAQSIDRGDSGRKAVSLTFDAGADTGYTATILDTLKRTGVRASFGLTGKWCEANPDLARRITAEGHTVVNHSDTHASWTGTSPKTVPLTRSQREEELRRAEAVLKRTTGSDGRPYFRSPYGDRDATVQRDLGEMGYRYNVLWTFDSQAWRGAKAEAIIANGIKAAAPGAIFIFHVDQQQDALALGSLIERLKGAGYGFLTIPELLEPSEVRAGR